MADHPRVLVLSNYDGPVNPIRAEAEIFIGLKRRDFEITVMTPLGGVYGEKLQHEGITVLDVHPKSKFDRTYTRQIKHAVERFDIDIVHAFNSKSIANASWAVWGNKQVKLVSYRGYTGNISKLDPTNYLSFLNPRIDYMVCLAESVRQVYLKNGVDPAKAITINKGHDPSWYEAVQAADLSQYRTQPNQLLCSFVANHRIKMKGVRYLVEAVAMLSTDHDLKVLMIGDGLDGPEVKKWIDKHHVMEKFEFLGFRSDASSIVKACDLSVSASLFGEATQKAVIEAMNLGNPVIISDIVGNQGMVENGRSGYVVPAANSTELARALNDQQLREKMGRAAKEHIQSFLSIERSVAEYEAFYDRIAKE